jgi:hypothetical protein
MPSHLALLSCLLVLVLSFDKFLFHYLKRRWFSGTGGGGSVPRGPSKSRRTMATAVKWSETAMLVIDMQVLARVLGSSCWNQSSVSSRMSTAS